MNGPNISVIVPVYNTSKYLRTCLDSIINQTLSNIEIIIINDCSPDPLDHDICTDYGKIDQRITYIKHKTNLGLGGARNSGLNIASGDYIWFVDSDDFIDLNSCEFLYKLADTKHVDVIAFSATSHVNGSLDLSKKKWYYYQRDTSILDQTLSGKDFIDAASLSQSFHVSACLHLFKRQLISNFRFRENVIHEDIDFTPVIIYNASSIYCIKYAPYYRLLREDSISLREINERTLVDKFSCVESLLNYAKVYNLHNSDPLLSFIHQQFNSIKYLYLKFEKKTEFTENLFSSLSNKYNNDFPGQSPLLVEDKHEGYKRKYLQLKQELDTAKKGYLHLKRELDTIKRSRFWKITEYLRRIKYIFKG
jgi:glycosyltransferase involved in cell wall biosynthesis